MNRQEIYEAQREYFSREGAVLAKMPFTGGGESCQYRIDPDDPTSGGCAVGCLIPNELYEAEMDSLEDGTSVDELYSAYPSLFNDQILEGVESEEWMEAFEWLRETQRLHDCAALNPVDFVRLLDEAARIRAMSVVEQA